MTATKHNHENGAGGEYADNTSYLVVDDLPDDLLDPPSHAIEGVVEAAFEGQSAERAIAPTARRELAVH